MAAEAEGNGLAATWRCCPPPSLTPKATGPLCSNWRSRRWQWQEFDEAALATLGAGAFLAVARVRQTVRPPSSGSATARPTRYAASRWWARICHDPGATT